MEPQKLVQNITQIPLDKIDDPQIAIRQDISPESVQDLVDSIREVGIIEPLIVRADGDRYEIIAGHRRAAAASIADLATVPCIIVEADDLQAQVLRLHENTARSEISPLDWAVWLNQLKQQFNLTTAKLAELLKMSEDWVLQRLAINNWPHSLQQAVKYGLVAFSAARELANVRDENKREDLIKYAIKGGCTPTLAARWRAEANSQPYTERTQPPQPLQPLGDLPSGSGATTCEICGEPIEPHELVTVTVHARCAPN